MPAPKSNLDAQLIIKRAELKSLNADIAERYQYRDAQERQINELVETGNGRLLELNHEIAVSKKVLKEVKADVREAMQEKRELHGDVKALTKQLEDGYNDPGLANAYA